MACVWKKDLHTNGRTTWETSCRYVLTVKVNPYPKYRVRLCPFCKTPMVKVTK